jgi:hypothetical protein
VLDLRESNQGDAVWFSADRRELEERLAQGSYS